MVISVLFCMAAGRALLSFGALEQQEKNASECQVAYLNGQDTIDFQELKEKQEELACLIGGYQVNESQQLNGYESRRERQADVVRVNFESDCLFSCGAQLHTEDVSGCLLDSDTMYTLFGTGHPSGQVVLWQGRQYTVRGILHSEQPLMVIQWREGGQEEKGVSGILLSCNEELYRNQNMETLERVFSNIEAQYYVKDYMNLLHWIELPVKWSDFGHWKTWLADINERRKEIMYRKKDVIENYFVQRMWEQLGYGLWAGFLLIGVILIWKKRKRTGIPSIKVVKRKPGREE